MTAEAVSQSLTKILCSHGGSMEYKMLKEQLKGQPREIQKLLSEILQDKSRFALRQGDPGSRPGCVISPNTVVAAKTAVRLCKKYPNETCHNCRDLHLCKFFVYGNCRYSKEQCRNIHDIKSGHNLQVLKRYGLQNLDERQLSALLLQNDSSLLPEEREENDFGGCWTLERILAFCLRVKIGWRFSQMWVRRRVWLEDECYFGRGCSSRSRESSVSSNSEGDSDEICLYYISKYCSFKEKCMNVHFHLPYKWEVFDGHSWSEIINMEQVEKDFCNPENIVSSGSPSVDYQNMTTGLAKVRRLSTVSSVTKKLHFSLTTKWIWYWKDEFGKWIEYGKQLVQLAQESEEFKQVLGHFQRTMPNATVSKINRIQNQDLWEMFQIMERVRKPDQRNSKNGDKIKVVLITKGEHLTSQHLSINQLRKRKT
ncbi:PAR12 polymerase, partial [Polypterus senegalus]